MTLYSFRSMSTLGVYGPHIYRSPKTAFNNSEQIAMKFDIEIVCTQEIIMGYMSLDNFSKKGVPGNPPPPSPHQPISFFLRLHEYLTEYFMTESYVSFLEKANDAIFVLVKIHFGVYGPRGVISGVLGGQLPPKTQVAPPPSLNLPPLTPKPQEVTATDFLLFLPKFKCVITIICFIKYIFIKM